MEPASRAPDEPAPVNDLYRGRRASGNTPAGANIGRSVESAAKSGGRGGSVAEAVPAGADRGLRGASDHACSAEAAGAGQDEAE